ncbi:MAG: hypothetical protein IIA61_02070 [Candidatus Marinimicrobia bacterium]|nr:hypothetical protein [Candidatus Neomarinimicrobiota bacterium]
MGFSKELDKVGWLCDLIQIKVVLNPPIIEKDNLKQPTIAIEDRMINNNKQPMISIVGARKDNQE